MIIDEAIKELRKNNRFVANCGYQNLARAMRLGMEALKYVKAQYDSDHQCMRRQLPGETSR